MTAWINNMNEMEQQYIIYLRYDFIIVEVSDTFLQSNFLKKHALVNESK